MRLTTAMWTILIVCGLFILAAVALALVSIRSSLSKVEIQADPHLSGWLVLWDGECVGELNYLGDDWPALLFQFKSTTADRDKIAHALDASSMRSPDSRLEFKCRTTELRVQDGEFVAKLDGNGIVRLRDFRGPVVSRKELAV